MRSVPAQKLVMCEHGEALRRPTLLPFILASAQDAEQRSMMYGVFHLVQWKCMYLDIQMEDSHHTSYFSAPHSEQLSSV